MRAFQNDMRRNPTTDGGAFGGWRAFLDALPDATCVVDELGRIVFANRRLHELTSHPPGSLDGRPFDLVVPRSRGDGRNATCRRADGSTFTVDVAMSALPHEGASWSIAILRDESERQRTQEELFRMATHDDLTGLANRALLLDRLERIHRRRGRQRAPLTVLFLDLDHFKAVNDADGHAAGDDVLRVVAEALESTFRPADTVARVGGDEFVIVCEDTTSPEGAALAERALAAVREGVRGLPHPSAAGVTASVGVVAATAGEDADALIARADAAMYAAKRAGGDQLLVA